MSCKPQSLQTGLLQKPLIPIAHLYHAPTHTTLAVYHKIYYFQRCMLRWCFGLKYIKG